MIRVIFFAGLASLMVALAVPPDATAATVIMGTVKNEAGKPLPGLALLEKGEIHNNVWDRGTLVGADGNPW